MSFVDKLTAAAKQAGDKAGELAGQNREKITGAVDKAASAIDKQTNGKYSDKVGNLKQQVVKGVDNLADKKGPGAGPTQ